MAAPAQAASTDLCSSSYAPANSYKAVPSHGQVFYIDSGVTPKVDAAYAGYKITNNTGSTQTFWVSLENFSGGSVSLANPEDQYQQISSLASGSTDSVFFLLKATSASTTAQKHVLKVYDKRPDLSGAALQFSCYYSFSKVAETIKASANKVTSVTTSLAPAVATLGGKLTITVNGDTGKIGAGSAPDTDIIWVSPAAVSSWPTRSLRLTGTSITLACSGKSNLVLTDELYYATPVADCYGQGASGTWTGVYTFQIIGPSQATVPIRPVAQISSGTQVKHSDIATAPANIDLTGVASTSVTLSKTASSTFETSTSTSARVTYTVTLATNSTSDITVDEIIDTPQSGTTYVAGSAKITDVGRSNSAIADPTYLASESALSPRPVHYTGPFTLKNTQNAVLTYKMDVPCSATPTAYSNSAYVKTGDQIIGASATTLPVAKVTTTSGSGSCTGTTETTTTTVTPSAQTAPASSVDTSTGTLNGFANAYGTSGVTAYFTYGTSSTLTSGNSTTSSVSVTGSSATAQSAVLTGLTPNTRYYFRMDVAYTGGVSKGTILYFDTPPQQATPTVITQPATAITTNSATLNGSINPNVTGIIKVEFIWGKTSTWPTSGTTTTTVQVDDGSASLVDLQLTGASPQSVSLPIPSSGNLSTTTSYTFKVRAWCDTTNMASYCSASPNNYVDGATQTFTTGTPSVVTSDATAVAESTVTMNGSVTGNGSAGGSITTYYEYCAASATCSLSAMSGTNDTTTSTSRAGNFDAATPVNVTGLTAGTTYYFRNVTNSGGTLYRGAIYSFKTLQITTSSLSNGNVNTAYSAGLSGTGGSSGYTWAVTTGSLPAGLSLDANTGLISGTPTGSETQTFTVTMTDVGFTTTTTKQYTIVISSAGQTITFATIADREYGSGNVTTSPTASSGLTVTLTSNSTDTCTVSGFVVTLKAVGTCSLTATQGGNGSYSAAAPVTRTFAITKKALTVTGLTAQNKVYNGSDTATVTGTPTLSGVLTADSATVSVSLGASSFSSATVGTGKTVTPTLTLSGAASGNYSLTTPSLTANITAVTVTVTASSPSTTYGTAVATVNASVSPSYSGFVNGESQAVLTTAPTCSVPTYTVTSNAGTTPASSCTGAVAQNYTFSYNNGTLTINKRSASLAVQAKTVSANTELDTTTIAFDIDDDLNNVLSKALFTGITCSTTYVNGDPVGTQGRNVSCSGGTATNYRIDTYTANSVTVTGASRKAVITPAAVPSKSYVVDSTTAQAALDDTSTVKGWTVSYSQHNTNVCTVNNDGVVTIRGVGLCKVTATSVNANNDSTTIEADPVDTEFEVLPETVTLTSSEHTITYGDAAPTISLVSKSGFRNGETETVLSGFSCTTTYSPGSAAGGSYETSCDGSNPNYIVAKVKKTVIVGKRTLTATPTVIDKVYDGNSTATVTTITLGNKYGSDDVYGDTTTATASFTSSDVDTYTVVVNHNAGFLKGSTANNYQISDTSTATQVRITKRSVTPSITVADKVYDGDTTTVIATKSLTNKVDGDAVDFDTSTVRFASADVSDAQSVTTSGLTLTGAKANNYSLNSLSGITGKITPKTLTVNPTVPDKIYDGTTSAVLQSATLSGVVGTDDVDVDTTTVSVSFPSADVDTHTVIVPQNGSNFLKGTKRGNYQVATTSNATAKILRREVTPSLTVADKVYDGETTTVVASKSLSNKVSGDDVDIETTTVVFASPDVNDSQTVMTSGITLKGGKAGNYSLNALSGVTGKITKRPLTVTPTVIEKEYDGTNAATVTSVALGNVVSSDTITADTTTANAVFGGADVADTYTVTVTHTDANFLQGSKKGNYSVPASSTVTNVKIKPKTLTVTPTIADKIYDDTITATLQSASLSGVVGSDDVAVDTSTVTPTFPSANVDTLTVTVTQTGTGFLKGGKKGNYKVGETSTATAKILPRPITIRVETQTVRVGQALGTFTVTPNAGGLVSGHTLTCTVVANVDTMTIGTYTDSATISSCEITGPQVGVSGRFGLANVGIASTETKTPNYTQVYLSGAVIVTDKYVPNITWATPTVLTYGETLTSTRLNARASHSSSSRAANEVLGSYTYKRDTQTVTSATVLDAGDYDLDVEFAPDAGESDTYTATTARRQVQVNKKNITVRTQDLTIDAGGTCTFTATVTGLVGSESLDTFTFTGQNCATAGSYTVTPSGGSWGNGGKAANYNVTYVAGTLTVRGTNATTTNSGGGRGYNPAPPAPRQDEKEIKVDVPNGGAIVKPKDLQDTGEVQKLVTPSNKKDVTVSIVPGVNGLKVEAPPAFSGKVSAVVETLKDGVPTLVTTIITIPPAEPKDPASSNKTLYTSTVNWKPSPSDVLLYQVKVDGELMCVTKATSCTVKKTITPDTDVHVVAIGNDDTISQPEVADYKPGYVLATLVRFDENSPKLKSNPINVLVSTARKLKETGFTHLYVAGYTDAQGGTKNAKALSTARAKQVVATLRKMVPGIKVTMIEGKGLQNPVASNSTKKGQSLNRRAEVYVRY